VALKSLIVLFLASITYGRVLPSNFNSTNIDERIIGGKEVVKNSYPFMVRIEAISKSDESYLCGGTLIHENYIVTAAHCVYDDDDPIIGLIIHFGDHHVNELDDTQTIVSVTMRNVFFHEDYDYPRVGHNDIALIRLPEPAPLSRHVKPICIARRRTVERYHHGKALGWGDTSNVGPVSDVLKEIDLPILADGCRKFSMYSPDIMICAGNTEGKEMATCSGDSGGPFVVDAEFKPVLAGVTSFGSAIGCVTIGYGVVFARVSAYIPWLSNLMGSALCIV